MKLNNNIEINKLLSIKSKLLKLESLDSSYSLFGSEAHCYQLNPICAEQEVRDFESRFDIALPNGYRHFLLELGNGGAGPYYGVEKLQDSLFIDLDAKREDELLDPSKPFMLTDRWNMSSPDAELESEAFDRYEAVYFDDKWVNGVLNICNFGCGVSLNLVVNGPEAGNIWVDDRGNDGGIYPVPYFQQIGRTDFLSSYELWLDRSLLEMGC